MNPFDPDIFSAENPCVCCGTAACACALLIPSNLEGRWGAIYGSYAAASAFIANRTSNCIGYGESGSLTALASFTATNTTPNQLVLQGVGPDVDSISMYGSLTVPASTVLTVAFTFDNAETDEAQLFIYDCATGSTVYHDTRSGSPFTTPSLPAGIYVIEVVATNTGVSLPAAATFTITTSTSFVVNPVIARWDDSGTTRSLYACPRLKIIPSMFSPFGAPLYPNTGAANSAFSAYVASCVGVITNNPANHISFAATDSGTSLRLNGRVSDFAVNMLGSVNVLAGETIDFAFTLTADLGTPSITINIVDNEGNIVATIGPTTSSPQSSVTMPYSGDYFITAQTASDDPSAVDVSCNVLITSSGTLSVNPVAALVDEGVDCPFVYDC